MKKILCYLAILALVCAVPVKRADVGKLRPIQTVQVSRKGDLVTLRTDTKDMGSGSTVRQALENLKATTPGVVYLDTAEFLILSKNTLDCVEELREVLHGNVKLCIAEETIQPAEVTQYLSSHEILPKLKNWQQEMPLPVLIQLGERLLLKNDQ